MLNELLIVERGAKRAGIEMAQRHPDIKDARRIPTLLVRLSELGHVAEVRPVPREVTPWTLRDGQHNSFPFVQPKQPFWTIPLNGGQGDGTPDRTAKDKRRVLLQMSDFVTFNEGGFADWPGAGLLERVRQRNEQLRQLRGSDARVVPATFERFLTACENSEGPRGLLAQVATQLTQNLRTTTGSDWVDVAMAILVEGAGALMFDAAEDASILDPRIIANVSEALRTHSRSEDGNRSFTGCCALTGDTGPLVDGKFPQPNLPLLGQTYLFARNKDIPANDRYGQFSAESMPVGQETAIRLAAAAEALTSDDRKGVTWRGIPGEAPNQTDLLLAFVEAVPDAPVVPTLVEDESLGEWPSEEEIATQGDSVATFEQRTQRLIDAVQAKTAPLERTPVRFVILRKVDPANRKVSYQGQIPVADLVSAAGDWAAGERNVPSWVPLLVPVKRVREWRAAVPPHVAPLSLITLIKHVFIRGGMERQEIAGLPASEVLSLFLEQDRMRAVRVLRLVLARREPLLAGTAHAMRKGLDAAKQFDRGEALKTVTILGLLLHKLGRRQGTSEDYMSHEAFRFGQLLAAVDIVHVGYCADVRGGDVPPSLLGNQVFTMAQTSPVKALNALARRWKPYAGWAMKSLRLFDARANRRRDELLRESKKREEIQRGWDISRALATARRVQPMIEELRSVLTETPDDMFRAELLLGYIAGIPKPAGDASMNEGQAAESARTEE